MERSKVDKLLESIFIEEGPEGIVESMSFLYGAFVVTCNGMVLGANDAFCELVDYPISELRGKPATDLVAADQKAYLKNIFESNGITPYELTLLSKIGELKHTRVSPKIFTVRGQIYRLAEFVDFTDNFHIQRTLRESENKFRTFFQHAAIGIARVALQGDWQELNPRICAILGYSEAELRKTSFVDITYPEDLEKDVELLGELQSRERNSYSLEKRYIRKDKTIIWGRLTVTLIRDADNKPEFYIVFIEDINEQKLLNNKLQTSDLIVSASSDMLAVLNENCEYIAVNKTYAYAFGMNPPDLIGVNVKDIFDKALYEALLKANQDLVRTGKSVNFSGWFNYPITGKQYMNVSYSPVLDADSKYQGFAVSARNITELKLAEMEMRELNEKLQRYSYLDGLTRITNRRMFDETIDNEWNRAIRNDSDISLIMIDIDFFKNYNDHYGHLKGDECLVKIAQKLKEVASRSSDVVARYGGEEFAILVPSANLKHATHLAERCRQAIIDLQIPHATTEVEGLKVVSVSVGVSSMVPAMKSSAFTLLDIADKRLYKAKHSGRNCTVSE